MVRRGLVLGEVRQRPARYGQMRQGGVERGGSLGLHGVCDAGGGITESRMTSSTPVAHPGGGPLKAGLACKGHPAGEVVHGSGRDAVDAGVRPTRPDCPRSRGCRRAPGRRPGTRHAVRIAGWSGLRSGRYPGAFAGACGAEGHIPRGAYERVEQLRRCTSRRSAAAAPSPQARRQAAARGGRTGRGPRARSPAATADKVVEFACTHRRPAASGVRVLDGGRTSVSSATSLRSAPDTPRVSDDGSPRGPGGEVEPR